MPIASEAAGPDARMMLAVAAFLGGSEVIQRLDRILGSIVVTASLHGALRATALRWPLAAIDAFTSAGFADRDGDDE